MDTTDSMQRSHIPYVVLLLRALHDWKEEVGRTSNAARHAPCLFVARRVPRVSAPAPAGQRQRKLRRGARGAGAARMAPAAVAGRPAERRGRPGRRAGQGPLGQDAAVLAAGRRAACVCRRGEVPAALGRAAGHEGDVCNVRRAAAHLRRQGAPRPGHVPAPPRRRAAPGGRGPQRGRTRRGPGAHVCQARRAPAPRARPPPRAAACRSGRRRHGYVLPLTQRWPLRTP